MQSQISPDNVTNLDWTTHSLLARHAPIFADNVIVSDWTTKLPLGMQPFVAVGLKLKEYGHRVRVATHAELRGFVEQFGLEFYPLGGDPQVLADFAVQSKGELYLVLQISYTCSIPNASLLRTDEPRSRHK